MPYLMGGFPTLEASRQIGLACADAGADLVEVGVPFSYPLADVPVIHAAGTEALRAGATPLWVREVCAAVSERIPVVLMAYANLVLGHDGFLDQARAAGASGLIVPDLPHDEAGDLRAELDSLGMALVPLAAPSSTDERLPGAGGGAARGASAATRAGSSTRCRLRGRPGSATSCRRGSRGRLIVCARRPRCRWPSASGTR